jgi:AhpD family alkylhydroperoxidase
LRSQRDSPDIVRMLLYRPGFLTRSLLDLTAEAMRGPSFWTAGEREYLAMSTAQLHECPFCVVTHAELTRIAGEGEIDPDDASSARPELRAVRAFLDTVTLAPDRADASMVAGLPELAVLQALRVNLVWNIVNRLATRSASFSATGSCRAEPALCTGSATDSPVSCSPKAVRPSTVTSCGTCGIRC